MFRSRFLGSYCVLLFTTGLQGRAGHKDIFFTLVAFIVLWGRQACKWTVSVYCWQRLMEDAQGTKGVEQWNFSSTQNSERLSEGSGPD